MDPRGYAGDQGVYARLRGLCVAADQVVELALGKLAVVQNGGEVILHLADDIDRLPESFASIDILSRSSASRAAFRFARASSSALRAASAACSASLAFACRSASTPASISSMILR
jgi:hypothetical protein